MATTPTDSPNRDDLHSGQDVEWRSLIQRLEARLKGLEQRLGDLPTRENHDHSAVRTSTTESPAVERTMNVATFAVTIISLLAAANYVNEWVKEGKFTDQLHASTQSAAQAATDARAAIQDLETAQASFQTAIQSAAAVHESLWFVSRGEQELHVQKNVASAKAMAERADRLLAAGAGDILNGESRQMAQPVQSAIWLLQAECALYEPNSLGSVEYYLRLLRSVPHQERRDVHRLEALWRLHKASQELEDIALRFQLLKESEEQLDLGMAGEREGHKSLIYLSVAALDRREFTLARQSADQFLAAFPRETARRERLGAEAQALIVVAQCWGQLATFLEQPTAEFQFNHPECGTQLTSLTEPDGRLFLTFLDRIQAALESSKLDGDIRSHTLQFCNSVRNAISLSMGGCQPVDDAVPNHPGDVQDAPAPPVENGLPRADLPTPLRIQPIPEVAASHS